MIQEEFQFNAAQTANAADDELAMLLDYLRGRSAWTPASVLAIELGLSDRKVRALAASSDLIASAPGTPGYKHLYDCTGEEIATAATKLKSQGRKMWQRGQRLLSNFHKSVQRHD